MTVESENILIIKTEDTIEAILLLRSTFLAQSCGRAFCEQYGLSYDPNTVFNRYFRDGNIEDDKVIVDLLTQEDLRRYRTSLFGYQALHRWLKKHRGAVDLNIDIFSRD